MGRHAGWLTAAAALGRPATGAAPHLLLVPEVPLALDQVLASVEGAIGRHGSAVVVTAETVRTSAGDYLSAAAGEARRDAFGHPLVTGTADYLANRIGAALGVKARTVKPGPVQRAASSLVSTVDRDEAWQVGAAAARLLAGGQTGLMVTLQAERDPTYRSWCEAVPLVCVAGLEKRLPASFLEVQPGGVCNVTAAFADYARPLLGGPPPTFMRL